MATGCAGADEGYSGIVPPEPPNSDGKSFSFGRPSAMCEHSLLVVHMDLWREGEAGNGRCENIDHFQRRMLRHQVAATQAAEFAVAHFSLRETRDMFGALGHLDGVGSPERERVHRPPDQERHDRQWQ